MRPAPETKEEWLALPQMITVDPDPYRACPHCESGEFGAIDPFTDRLTYRCRECGGLFRGRPGIDTKDDEEDQP